MWRSSDTTCAPPMWPGFKSSLRESHMWVEFDDIVGPLPFSVKFFTGYSGLPPSSKTNIFNSNSVRNQEDQEPLSGCATSKSLFIYFYMTMP